MRSKISKWGNSLGLRLPHYVVQRTELRPGDYLFVRLTDTGDIVVCPVKEREVHAAYPADDVPPEFKQGALAGEEW